MVDQYIALAIYAGLGLGVFIFGLVWKLREGHNNHDRFNQPTENDPRPKSSYHVVAH